MTISTAAAARQPGRVLLIANPISGGGKGRDLAPKLSTALRERGVRAEIYFTKTAGDAARRAAQAGEESWDGLIALGGDGTVNEVLNGMPDPSRPLGVLPVGTANVLALELGLPSDVDAAAATIAAGHLQDLAIGSCNGRRFLLFIGIGVDGEIVKRHSEARKGTIGKLSWLRPLLQTVWSWPRADLTVTCDGGAPIVDVSSVLIARVSNYGGIMRLPGVERGSGELHVLAFHMRSRLRWLYHGLRATLGRMRPGKHLTIQRAHTVRVDGSAPLQVDGDFGGGAPVTASVLPSPARLYVPTSPTFGRG